MDLIIDNAAKKFLLKTARSAVSKALDLSTDHSDTPEEYPGLDFQSGCFVSLHHGKSLRGCIGNFRQDVNIIENVSEMAVQAAIDDPRFPPLTKQELEKVKFEISVLFPMIRINSIEEARIGRDGLYVINGRNKGVLLPQVAVEYGWDIHEFIAETCVKAGLSAFAWEDKKTEIYRFEAIVFNEDTV